MSPHLQGSRSHTGALRGLCDGEALDMKELDSLARLGGKGRQRTLELRRESVLPDSRHRAPRFQYLLDVPALLVTRASSMCAHPIDRRVAQDGAHPRSDGMFRPIGMPRSMQREQDVLHDVLATGGIVDSTRQLSPDV